MSDNQSLPDLIERLRTECEYTHEGASNAMLEAADEIEALRVRVADFSGPDQC